MSILACVCSVCLCWQPGSFGMSGGHAHGAWEQGHNDQVNILNVLSN